MDDNAPNMKRGLKIIREKQPHIYTTTCSAHAAHHILTDVMKLKENSSVLENCKNIIKYFKYKIIPSNEFKIAQNNFSSANISVGNMLKLPVITRWGSEYDAIKSVLDNKVVFEHLVEQEAVKSCMVDQESIVVKNLIEDKSFRKKVEQTIQSTTTTPLMKKENWKE